MDHRTGTLGREHHLSVIPQCSALRSPNLANQKVITHNAKLVFRGFPYRHRYPLEATCLPQPLPGVHPRAHKVAPDPGSSRSAGTSPAEAEPLLLISRHTSSLGTLLTRSASAGRPLTRARHSRCETCCSQKPFRAAANPKWGRLTA